MVRNEDLDFWIQNRYNVLFVGHAGVGKTSIIKDAFERNNLSWRYFSASTMDPWVDLVGVPKEKKDENGNSYLDLVRPKEFENDELEALFFDEFNRSHKKVRNACMELIQFKSINGKPFNNLKLIWAAINPDDDETYDVEKLDPAQEDRFHVKVTIPYKPTKSYFIQKYGDAKAAISWWDGLPTEVKAKVSPRRLDYALDMLDKKGDIRYVLPEASNVAKLLTTLKHGPISETLQKMQDEKAIAEAKTFLAIENNYAAAIEWITKRRDRVDFFLPVIPLEKLSNLISTTDMALESAISMVGTNESIKEVVLKIMTVGSNSKIISKIKSKAKHDKIVADALGIMANGTPKFKLGAVPTQPFFAVKVNNLTGSAAFEVHLDHWLGTFQNNHYHSTQDRKKVYKQIVNSIPSMLSSEQAIKTLKVLNVIAWYSQVTTLVKLQEFMGIVNHCIDQFSQQNNHMSWNDIEKKQSKSFSMLYLRIKSNIQLGEKLYCPMGGVPRIWGATLSGSLVGAA